MSNKKHVKKHSDIVFNIDDIRKFCGVAGYVRSSGVRYPVFKYGLGSKLVDFKGREYIDLFLSSGRLVLGHSHKNVVLAAKKAAEYGIDTGFVGKEVFELKELILSFMQGSQNDLRFLPSEETAISYAISVARKYNSKNKIIVFDGAHSGLFNCDENDIICLQYDDIDAFLSLVENDSDISAVVVEPVATRMGIVLPSDGFLKNIREAASRRNIVLIFDEINTGFRVGSYLAQNDIGIYPDITCLGKVIGGGFSLGVCCARQELLDLVDAVGIAGNRVIIRSALAAIKLIDKEFLRSLCYKSSQLAEGINKFLVKENICIEAVSFGSMISLRRSIGGGLRDRMLKEGHYAVLFKCLLERGILISPDASSVFYLSNMHSRRDVLFLSESFKYCLSNLDN
jgi:glutamate-1-semialdehyde 2,1-aminomutase